MSHKSSQSTDSTTSTQSNASAITVMTEDFKERYGEVDNKNHPLPDLVSQAKRLVDGLGTDQDKDKIEYSGISVQAHDVLNAMLEHAEGCGGERGKRYTATAICACVHNKVWQGKETLEALHDLARTWISHLLFVFKCGSHSQQLNKTPSEIATPSYDDTSTLLDNESSATCRRTDFRTEVLKRDGYQCIVTKLFDYGHPTFKHSKSIGVPRYKLEACHILRRAVAVFKSDQRDRSYLSAVATFDILRNYANLPEEVMDQLKETIDDPSNGFLLDARPHSGFDSFDWCLKATETPNTYVVTPYSDFAGLSPDEINRIIEFRDRSEEFASSGSRKRKAPGVELPNPGFIAIHAAIAGILHMSGAGRFFDELLDKFGDGGDSFPVRCWEEFERMVQLSNIKEQLAQTVHVQ